MYSHPTDVRSLARALFSADLVAAVALAVASGVLRGPPAEVDDDIVVSFLLLGVGLVGLYQLERRDVHSYVAASGGTLVGMWLVGVSFDFGLGHTLMWIGVIVGASIVVTHLALARLTTRHEQRPIDGDTSAVKRSSKRN